MLSQALLLECRLAGHDLLFHAVIDMRARAYGDGNL